MLGGARQRLKKYSFLQNVYTSGRPTSIFGSLLCLGLDVDVVRILQFLQNVTSNPGYIPDGQRQVSDTYFAWGLTQMFWEVSRHSLVSGIPRDAKRQILCAFCTWGLTLCLDKATFTTQRHTVPGGARQRLKKYSFLQNVTPRDA